MDLSSPTPTTNSPLTPVFGNNVQDLLGAGALNVNPTGIIVVNSIADTVNDNDGVTTLREAINQANADAGEDLIVFDRSLFSTAQTITLSGTELDITHNLDIIAPRDPLTGGDLVTVSGNNASRVFEIETGATVSIDGLIVADGSVRGDDGGGIKNSGALTLDSSIVRNNSAFSDNSAPYMRYGGGIYNSGSLTVNNSTINRNSRYNGLFSIDGNGGGISNSTSGILNVNNSTISGNSANAGGGIRNDGILNVSNSTISGNSAELGGGIFNGGTLNVSNSTISGNSASGSGGGIFNGGTLNVSNSTISGNSASGSGGGILNHGKLTLAFSTFTLNQANNGGGVYNFPGYTRYTILVQRPGSTNVRNTIIASNLNSASGVNPDVSGTFISNGYNLIGDSTGSLGFRATGDIVGTKDNPIDPVLAPLAFNGGSTQNFALLPDSPAIDAGDPTILDTDPTTDQRGFPRVSGGRADMGAFEV